MSRTPSARLSALAGALLAVSLAAGACSSSEDTDGGAVGAGDAPAAEQRALADGLDAGGVVAASEAEKAGRAGGDDAAQEALVISTGTVSLRSDDVAKARFDVQKVVDRAGGRVTDEETHTSDDGEVEMSRMVLRVPSDSFDATMAELKGFDGFRDSTTESEDVTTQVIDNKVRIRVQRASIRRIAVLLDRAEAIGDVVRIEHELSRRQSELNSLLRRQAYLADQTSLSTITVHLERTSEKKRTEDDDDAGFLSGLDAGWSALSTFAVALVTLVGVLLPWLAVLFVLGVPLWWLQRKRRKAPPAPPAVAED